MCLRATAADSAIVPPVSAFETVTMSGTIPAASAREHRAGAAETGENFVQNQRHAVAIGHPAKPPQHLGRVKDHAPRPLHQRLDQHAGNLVAVRVHIGFQRGQAPLVPRQRQDRMLSQQRSEQSVHALIRIAHRHRRERVAVIAAGEGHKARVRVRTPWFNQYCAAIFIATSTATEPLSAKNTWFKSPGSSAQSFSANASAGSCVKPPNITCGMRSSCRVTAARICGWL